MRPRPCRIAEVFFGEIGLLARSPLSRRRPEMSPLRMRMIEDMILSGLAAGTQATYIDAVRRLAAHYRRSPDRLSEEEVRAYILHLRESGAARGTFKTNHYGLQYFYRQTLNRDWALFSKKRSACPSRSAYPMRLPTPRCASCSPSQPTRSTGPASRSCTRAVYEPARR